jgi:hypothetical protein
MPRRQFPIEPNFSGKRLSDATVQEIHLELFRRSIAAEFAVDRFIEILLANRHLWRGLLIDRLGVSERGHRLQPSSMIKLRDIDQNFWNADTLHLLCPNRQAAEELVAKLPMEEFACMPSIEDDPQVVDRALGGGDDGAVILQFWWD